MKRAGRGWARRLARGAALTVLIVALVYLVAMNVVLRTRILRDDILGFSPEEVRVEYVGAYSLWPGRIHVDGLSIRGSDSAVEWILRLEHCDFVFHPGGIFQRMFHASQVRGDGVSFRLRMRLLPDEVVPETVDALPPVPGFSDPPLLLIGPPKPPPTDAEYKLIGVQLDDVVAEHVREIWTQTLHVRGDMKVTGRWLFRPLRWLEVGPARVEVREARVDHGTDRPLSTGVHGDVTLTVHPFDVREPDGLEILRYMSAEPRLAGTLHAAELLSLFAGDVGATFASGEGPFELGAHVDHGKLAAGSSLTASLPALGVGLRGLDVSAGVSAALTVAAGPPDAASKLTVGLTGVRLAREGGELARAATVGGAAEGPTLNLAAPSLDGVHYRAELHDLRAPSVAPLAPFLRGARVEVGSGQIVADAQASGDLEPLSAKGAAELSVASLQIARAEDRAIADLEGRVLFDAQPGDGAADLSGSAVTLRRLRLRLGGVGATSPAVAVSAPRASIHGGAPAALELDVDAPRVDVDRLAEVGRRLPPGAGVQVLGGRARGSARVHVSSAAGVVSGRAAVRAEDVALSAGGLGLRTTARLEIARGRYAWKTGDARAGSVGLDLVDAALVPAGDGEPLVRAKGIEVRGTDLELQRGAARGTVSLRAPDLEAPRVASLAPYLPTKIVQLEGGAAQADVEATLDLASRALSGELRAWTRGLRTRVSGDELASDLSAQVHARPGAVPGTTDVSGTSIVLTPVDGASGSSGARLELTQGSVRLGDSPAAAARVTLEAHGLGPLEAIVARASGVPRWLIQAVVPSRTLVAEANLSAGASRLEVSSLLARAGETSVRLEYRAVGEERSGVALVHAGIFDLGFRLAGPGRSFVPFGASTWFARAAETVRAEEAIGR